MSFFLIFIISLYEYYICGVVLKEQMSNFQSVLYIHIFAYILYNFYIYVDK